MNVFQNKKKITLRKELIWIIYLGSKKKKKKKKKNLLLLAIYI